MKKIGLLTSGGDAPGMNAAIRAVVRTALRRGLGVTGFVGGYAGVIGDNCYDMGYNDVSGIIDRGGTILKTARCLEMMSDEGRDLAAKKLKDSGIEGLVVIGGDGSFRGAQELSHRGINTIGIPGTIDNDLSYTSYTIGYDTAANTAMHAIDSIRDTMRALDRIAVVEVMGRYCGDLALYAGLACGAQTIVVPERPFDPADVLKKVLESEKLGRHYAVIVFSEGIRLNTDRPNHMGPEELAKYLDANCSADVRATTLGHIQRGGSPTAFDRVLATKMGVRAVDLLLEGKTDRVIGTDGMKLIDMNLDEALKVPRVFDEELYTDNDIVSI